MTNKGFSLLEILIVTSIMGVIALLASGAIKNGLQNKSKMDARLQTETAVFDALRLMTTDIEKAFHYQYALYEIDKQAIATTKKPDGTPVDPTQIPPAPERLTNFIGTENAIHFTTSNNQRTTVNSQESNVVEVGYYVNDCKTRTKQKASKCLWRRTSSVLDNDVTRDGTSTILLDNVTSLKLEYLNEDKNDKEWHSRWLTDANGDARTQNMFPYMVKINLEVHDPDNKAIGKFAQTVIATIRFTNNADPAKKFATGGSNIGGGPAGTNVGGSTGGTTGGNNTGGGSSGGSTGGGDDGN